MLQIKQFTNGFSQYREKWADFINFSQRKAQKVAVWGAASKGVIFSHHMRDMGVFVDAVVDINTHKQGSYIPTGQEIIKPEDIKKNNICTIIVANPMYMEEIEKYCKKLCLHVYIVGLE